MNISLHYKLFGAFLAAILMVVVYMVLVMQWSFDRGFLRYVNRVEHEQLERLALQLEEYYRQGEGWGGIHSNPVQFMLFMVETYPEGRQKERLKRKIRERRKRPLDLPTGPLPSGEGFPFFLRVFLLDSAGNTLIGFDPAPDHVERIDLYYQNRVVGTVGVHFARNLSGIHQLLFAKQHKWALLLVALAGFLIAAGLSLPFSHRLTRPIRQLAGATRDLASGKYETRINVSSGDELGRLAGDFNNLADILEKNRKSRSRWFADISHELRTPIAILQGKVEALQDGVYSPDKEMLASLHREVSHLGRLVDDLYQLSLSDQGAMSYNRVDVDPGWALERAVESLRSEAKAKGLVLDLHQGVEDVVLFADNERLTQLFTNLLANSVRYTDPGGQIVVKSFGDKDNVYYIFEDSAPGVGDEHLGELFDRLYRVESSRSREYGGAGLGLSICKNIVKAHGGRIEAAHSRLGGLEIKVSLPVSEHI